MSICCRLCPQLIALLVYLCDPAVGQLQLEPAEERQGKDDEQQEQQHVEHGIGRHSVERVGAEECRDKKPQGQIDNDDAQPVGHGIANALALIVLGTLQEEADRHGDNGPDARHEHGQQSAHEPHQQDVEQRMGGYGISSALSLQLVDDRSPEKAVGSGRQCVGNSIRHVGRQRLRSVSLRFLLIILSFSPLAPRLAILAHHSLLAKRHLCWRQTHLVAASAILQVAVDGILWLGETHLLDECGLALEEAKLHAEHLVVLLNDIAAGLEPSHSLCTLHLDGAERGRNGAVIAQVCRVHVPPFVNGGCEDDFCLAVGQHLQLRREMHGVEYLAPYTY